MIYLLSALTKGETALAIMLPVIAVVAIVIFAIVFTANRKGSSNEPPRTIFEPERKKPEKKREPTEPQKAEQKEKPAATTAPTEILLTPPVADEQSEATEGETEEPQPAPQTEADEIAEAAEAEETEQSAAEVETAETAEPTESEQAETEEKPQAESAPKPLKVRYVRSFTAKLILAPEPIKEYYAEIRNKLLSYVKVKNRVGWSMSSFNFGRNKLCKINVRGKALYMYVALDPKDFAEAKFKVKDVSEKKRYALVPCKFKVRSARGRKHALELIEKLVEKYELAPAKKQIEPIAASDYPIDTENNLITRGLIKVKVTGSAVLPAKELAHIMPTVGPKKTETKPQPTAVPPKKTEIKPLKSVSVTQAQQLMTSEVAATLVKTERIMHTAGKKYAVNIDVLASHFDNGDKVDIAALKKKRLVPKHETAIKILARGTLNKKLIIRADDFSADAVKMIALTGGQAIKLKR